jgi:hypothetical protein
MSWGSSVLQSLCYVIRWDMSWGSCVPESVCSFIWMYICQCDRVFLVHNGFYKNECHGVFVYIIYDVFVYKCTCHDFMCTLFIMFLYINVLVMTLYVLGLLYFYLY